MMPAGCTTGQAADWADVDRAPIEEAAPQPTPWTVTAPDGRVWKAPRLLDATTAAHQATVEPTLAMQRLAEAMNAA